MSNIELRKVTLSDLDPNPDCCKDVAELRIFSHVGMLFPNGVEEKPVYYFRHNNVDKPRWAGLVELGDDPLAHQISGRQNELAQGDTPFVSPYGKLDDNSYGVKTTDGRCEIVYTEKGIHVKEKDVLDIEIEPILNQVIQNDTATGGSLYISAHTIIKGTLDGKPVEGMGLYDRSCIGDISKVSFAGLTYFSTIMSCIREDGRKEYVNCTLNGDRNGVGSAIYCLEGEEPIITNEVWLDTKWYRLPYVPENDHTVAFKDAVWRFADKEFHIDGKWGTKGFLDKPVLEKVGQSQMFGRGYVGKEAYKQRLYHTMTEHCGATAETIRAMGFEVID